MISIRNIIPEDLPAIAEVHLRSFPKDHFTSRFTKKMLTEYLLVLTSYERYNIIALDEENRVLGYVIAGTKYHAAVNEYIKGHFFEIIKVLIYSPSFIADKIKTLVLKLTGRVWKPVDIISVNIIAVNPEVNSKGVGTKLLESLENELLSDGINEYILYVKENNKSAIAFYKKRAFEVVDKKGKSLVMKKLIAAPV